VIITFYSFKGGVGRSMALANIAELLYKRGLRVLMIDFDLEAPGLEGYFDVPGTAMKPTEVACRSGVIDMLMSFIELRPFRPPVPPRGLEAGESESFLHSVEPIENFITPIYPDNGRGALSLLPAGNRADATYTDYARRVLDFDWQDFYVNCNGEAYFDWFRGQIEKAWDVTLIDSRTGVTEMGGICTHHLGDVVVSFVATNRQNLDGIRMMAASFRNPQLIERRKRPLDLLFVPARVELSEEDKHDDFAAQFISELGPLFPAQFHFQRDPFLEFRLIYVPAYSYMERVAVRERERQSKAELIAAYERIASRLAQLAHSETRLAQAFSVTPVERLVRIANDLYEEMSATDKAALREVFSRLTVMDEGGAVKAQKVGQEQIGVVPESVIKKLGDARIIDRGTTIALTEPTLAEMWPRTREWLDQDREFLKWRAGITTLANSWLLANRSARYLLEFRPLREERKWYAAFPDRLNQVEKEYISKSNRAAARQLTAIAAGALFVFLAILAVTTAWFKNHQLKSEAFDSISAVRTAWADHAPPEKMLAALQPLQNSFLTLVNYELHPPWWNLIPLLSDKRLYDEVLRAYLDAIGRLLVIPTEHEIASMLVRLPYNGAPPDAVVYDALKAYLMMTSNPDKVSSSFVGAVFPSYLPEPWRSVAPSTTDYFEYYAINIGGGPASSPDPNAVVNARDYLLKRNPADRIYPSLLRAISTGTEQPQKLMRANLASPRVLVTGLEVSGTFTTSGWRAMQSAIDKLVLSPDDRWVIGTETTISDQAKLKTDLTSRFSADYINAWVSYLEAAQIARFADSADGAAKLKVLSDSHSPLLALLCAVSQSTRGARIGEAAIGEATLGMKQAGKPNEANPSLGFSDIARAFQPVHMLVGPNCDDQLVGPGNKQYIDALASLQLALEKNSQIAYDLVQSALRTVRSIERQFLVRAPSSQPTARLLEEPISFSGALYRRPVKK